MLSPNYGRGRIPACGTVLPTISDRMESEYDGEQEENRVDGDVPAQAADEVDGEGREEDADDGDGYALEHCDGGSDVE